MGATRLIRSALALWLAGVGFAANAGEHVYTATDPAWKAECGACHLAYPPELLPAASWRKLMAGLDDHFGTDASVEADTAEHIRRFLETHAASHGKRAREMALRITETRWFRKEHREVPASVWKNPRVKSAANCAVCHARAEQGDYGERTLRLPD